MTGSALTYEPRFYERAAQRQVARICGAPILTNVAWGIVGSPSTRPEIDAIVQDQGRAAAVEIKAHQLDEAEVAEILAKYIRLGFAQLIIVAPGFPPDLQLGHEGRCELSLDLIVFHPDLDEIRDWYATVWPTVVPIWIHYALATGRHHVRFVLAQPTGRGGLVIGQRRTRVYSTDTIRRLASRLPSPPVRVLWSPQRFSIPRDLSARGSTVTPLGGYVPVDIDGDRLHSALHACVITADQPVCTACTRYARREHVRLAAGLDPVTPVALMDSGGRGVHAYYRDEPSTRASILALSRSRTARIDEPVTASIKATIALPGSLHAGTTRPVTTITGEA